MCGEAVGKVQEVFQVETTSLRISLTRLPQQRVMARTATLILVCICIASVAAVTPVSPAQSSKELKVYFVDVEG